MSQFSPPARMTRLELPEREALIGSSVRHAERELEALHDHAAHLDLTYADTKRFPPPAGVLERFIRAAQLTGMSYTPYRGDASVREEVAANLGAFLGVSVDPATELILTPGSQSGLFCTLSALVDEGDRVVLFDPEYLSSERMVRHLGAEVTHVPLDWASADPSPDLAVLEDALADDPRLVLFSNPNNPTGAVYSRDTVMRIASLISEAERTTVVVDQLYSRLVFEGEFTHLLALEGLRERCVTLLGPSKSESMSGYRLGVAVAPPEIVDGIEDVLSLTGLRAPAYAQHTLRGWLRDDQDFMARRIDDYRPLRDHAVERFNASPALDVARPRGTAYLFPKVLGDVPDQVIARRLLTEAGLVVNPGYQSGPRGVGHFRVCFAQAEDAWERAVDDIVKIVEDAVADAQEARR